MSDIKQALGTSTGLTITLNSLAASATVGRESTAVDNGTNLFLDAICQVVVNVGVVTGNKQVLVYAYGSEDGTIYTDPATGADAGITLENPTTMKLVQVIPTPTASKSYESSPFSIAAAFGGVLPRKWGIVLINDTGVALAATGNSAKFSGMYATSI